MCITGYCVCNTSLTDTKKIDRKRIISERDKKLLNDLFMQLSDEEKIALLDNLEHDKISSRWAKTKCKKKPYFILSLTS